MSILALAGLLRLCLLAVGLVGLLQRGPRGAPSGVAARPAEMLVELSVENLLLIERARLRLGGGLNVLTGETGAGKTVLAHALDLLLGGRARSGIVRPGAGEAYVEGVFEVTADRVAGAGWPFGGLEDRELQGDRSCAAGADMLEIVLARRVGADGRTRAYVNGRTATVAQLRDLAPRLISFYGQHEHRKLTLAASQLEILDSLCGPGHEELLSACARAFAQGEQLRARLGTLAELSAARERELDLLEHEIAEIDGADLQEGEHERLIAERERVRRRDALAAAAAAAGSALAAEPGEGFGGAHAVAVAAQEMEGLGGVDPRLDELTERVRALVIESQDLASELADYAESQGAGGEAPSLEALEDRLATIERLTRKHGGGPAQVLDYAAGARARRDELLDADSAIERTREQLAEARAELDGHVHALREARRAAAERLAGGVRERLRALAMGDASFEVALAERDAGPRGADAVEFMLAPNPGVPAGPLREIASGGELSRVMLAITAVANAASDAAVVFDEIDAGIGGQTARAVGVSLRELGTARQVLCITHLAQVASLADRHFSIVKDTSVQPTRTTVVQLDDGEVVPELVRMLGADSQDAGARRHARELLRAA